MSTEKSTTRTPTSKRLSQVYVETPLNTPTKPTLHVYTSRKENKPPKSPLDSDNSNIMPNAKRKFSDLELVPPIVVINSPPQLSKKRKVAENLVVVTHPAQTVEFPNGSFYCHQCGKKRDASLSIQCTQREGPTKSRCKAKYCRTCLKNRYGENSDEIKGDQVSVEVGGMKNNIDGLGYNFKCPKCRDICNCSRCRKAKGLGPTGNLVIIANRAGADSVATLLVADPNATGVLPGKGHQIETIKKPRAPKVILTEASTTVNAKPPQARVKAKAGDIALPPPMWTALPVSPTPTSALARIQIREFILRFGSIIDGVGKGNMEELELIAGSHANRKVHDADEENGEECEWVSDACVKSLLVGIIGIICRDASEDAAKGIKSVLKELRSSSANLSKLWSILSLLRDSDSFALDFPDPMPSPSSAIVRTRRNATSLVVHGAQMIPVLTALCDRALECESVREEIEGGVREGREKTKEAREAIKKEIERWDKEKQAWEAIGADDANAKSQEKAAVEVKGSKRKRDDKFKEKRAKHKSVLFSLEQSLRIAMSAYAPRFGPLGSDVDGRTYWALSPGIEEQGAAMNVLTVNAGPNKGCKAKGRTIKGKRAAEEEERRGMKRWSWFLAVWGKRPDDADVRSTSRESGEDDDDEEEDDGSEKWWGFWEPEEIRRLAAFVRRRGGLSDEEGKKAPKVRTDVPSGGASPVSELSESEHEPPKSEKPSPSMQQLKELVKGLKEYADLLEWRIIRDEGQVEHG